MSGFLSSFIGMGGMVVGGILGGLITGGNPAGIAVGASLGGMVFGFAGQYLLPGSNELSGNPPPQPHENRIQISTYGQSIPLVYESVRLAGNVIYMQPVQRTVNRSRHRQDGVRYYEYIITYTSTFAIAFCEGPQEGICRIWVNGSIFADLRDSELPYYPSGSVGLAAGNLDTSIGRKEVYFTIYTGTETQTADTALSAILGATETPSYKGICYIVFRNFPIGEFTGIPKIEIETGKIGCNEYFYGSDGSIPYKFNVIYTGGVNEIQSGTLVQTYTNPDPGHSPIVETKYHFNGDFDIEVEFNGLIYPNATGWQYRMDAYIDSSHYFYVDCWCESGLTMNYVGYRNGGSETYPAYLSRTYNYGKLRIVRINDEFYAYRKDGSASSWSQIGTHWNIGSSGQKCFIRLGVYIWSAYPTSSVAWDNFIVNSGCDNVTWN